MTAHEQVMDRAAKVVIDGVAARAGMNPREAAEAAWYPGHRLRTVEAIEAEIMRRRAEDAQLIAHETTKAA